MRWWRFKERNADLERELRSDLELEEEEQRDNGLPAEEARFAARRAFGNLTMIREQTRETWGCVPFEQMSQDLQYALRQLRRSPGFTWTVVMILALGIGVNTSLFTLLDALLLRPLPVPEPQRVLTFFRGDHRPSSYLDYLDFRNRAQAFSGLAADLPNEGGLEAYQKSDVVQIEGVSYNYAQVLEAGALEGRWFSPEDERTARGEPLAVISYRIWHTVLSDDPNVLGKEVRIDGQQYTIIGVAPKELLGMSQPLVTDIWVPLDAYARHNSFAASVMDNRQDSRFILLGRLKPGATETQALAEMNALDGQLRRAYHGTDSNGDLLRSESVRGVSDPGNRRSTGQLAALMMTVATMVLLITCANIASLLLARGFVRRREMSIRVVLGARRLRIVRQTMVESMCLAAMGSLAGLVAAIGTNRFLELRIAAAPLPVAIGMNLSIDKRVLFFVFCATFFTTFVFGAFPAISASKPDLLPVLKGVETLKHPRFKWFSPRKLYVLGQVAISFVLVVISGLFIHALQNATKIEAGFEVRRLLSARLYMAESQFTEIAARNLLDRALERVRAMPGVQSATVSYASPLISPSDCIVPLIKNGEMRPQRVGENIVGADYFATLGVSLLAGRDFSLLDGESAPRVVVVNDILSHRYFPGQTAIGKRLRVGCGCENRKCYDAEIIGVVKNAKYANLDQPAEPYVFLPVTQHIARYVSLLIRTEVVPDELAPHLRRNLLGLDSRLQVYAVDTLSDQIDHSFWLLRWETSLIGGFGGLALVLAAVGLYGIVSTTVTQRTKEIGIRMALGARREDLLQLILTSILGLTLTGVAFGLGGSLLITRLLQGHLYGLNPADPITFVASVLLWALVALIASYIPVRRATRVDPTVTLRYE
jgi:predicted permease